MFRRRNKLSVSEKLQTWAWPRGGWRRSWQYLMFRLARMPGSAYSIAAGFACGGAASFTPFVGLHIIIAAFVAWIIRANVLASAVGTAVGNPWTFPFIWLWLYESGTWFLSGTLVDYEELPDFYKTFSTLMETAMRFEGHGFLEAARAVFWPMFLSGIPTALLVWFVLYFPLRNLIHRYQQRRMNRLGKNTRRWSLRKQGK